MPERQGFDRGLCEHGNFVNSCQLCNQQKSVPEQETPERHAQAVLEKIEQERFRTLDDPGIHGIKERIRKLGFVAINSEECCSGHPQDQPDLAREGRVLFEGEETNPHARGYISLRYKADDPRSSEFHDSLRRITAVSWGYEARHDSHGVRSAWAEEQDLGGNLNVEELRRVRSTDSPPASFEWLKRSEVSHPVSGPGLVIVPYEIRTRARPELAKSGTRLPEEQAEVLRRFWSEVSRLIQQYEAVPVQENLEPWYFAVRSRYGKMELTHQAFASYLPEIERRSRSGN